MLGLAPRLRGWRLCGSARTRPAAAGLETFAGVPGLEPGYLVLETRVLPLNDTPNKLRGIRPAVAGLETDSLPLSLYPHQFAQKFAGLATTFEVALARFGVFLIFKLFLIYKN